MSVTVRIPTPIRQYTEQQAEVVEIGAGIGRAPENGQRGLSKSIGGAGVAAASEVHHVNARAFV